MGSFVFPFALAHQVVAAMEDLAAQLRAVVNTHNSAIAIAHEDFEGDAREQFDRDFTDEMDALAMIARYLDGDADALLATIARAHYLEALTEHEYSR